MRNRFRGIPAQIRCQNESHCCRIEVTRINCEVPHLIMKTRTVFKTTRNNTRDDDHPRAFGSREGIQMPHAVTPDNVRLYFEESGSGTPILFLHEFAADHTNWEPQMRYFSRGHRCIAYSARGYTPSGVPASADAYTYKHFYTDAIAVLDHLK